MSAVTLSARPNVTRLMFSSADARLRDRALAAFIVALTCLLIAFLGGMFRLDPQIAGQWPGYHYGDTENRLNNINTAAEAGAAGLVLDYRDRETYRALENHDQNFYFDDVGYILFAQLYVLAFGEMTESELLYTHNAIFVLGLVGIAAAMALLLGAAPGLFSFAPLAGLHFLFRGFVYNTPSQPGMVLPMVAVAVALLLIIPALLTRPGVGKASWSFMFVAGAVIGAIVLVRYPIGSGAFLAAVATVLIAGQTWRRRGLALVALLAGSLFMQHVVPGLASMHRDAQLGWARDNVWSYFRAPPKHKPWFTMLALVGRYENSLDLVIQDSAVDQLLSRRKSAEPDRWPGDYAVVFDTIARDVLFDYIAEHPAEYVSHRIRGGLELFAVVPGVTFQSGDNFAGSPNVSPRLANQVDPRDLRPASGQIINVRFAYLDLTAGQWALYGLALAAFVGTIVYAVLNWRRQRAISFALAGVGVLWLLYGFARALIPWFGQDFVFVSWLLPALGVAWMASDALRRFVPGAAAPETAGA
jgi:hypothetical protein